MQKKLTITVDERVYAGLHAVVGRRRTRPFIESLAPLTLHYSLSSRIGLPRS